MACAGCCFGSFLFFLGGLLCLAGFAVFLRQRQRLADALQLPLDSPRHLLLFWIPFTIGTLVAGISMLSAMVVLWSHPRMGLLLGLWPVCGWALMGILQQMRTAQGQTPDPRDLLGPH